MAMEASAPGAETAADPLAEASEGLATTCGTDAEPLQVFELSPNSGEGERSMHDFVQENIGSGILRPLAERLLQVEARCRALEEGHARAQAEASAQEERLSEHNRRNLELSDGLSRAQADLASSGSTLAEVTSWQAAMIQDWDQHKAFLEEQNERLRQTYASVEELLRYRKESGHNIELLQTGLADTIGRMDKAESDISDLWSNHEGLNARHLDMLQTHGETRKTLDVTDEALKTLKADLDKQRRDDSASFLRLDERSKQLEYGLNSATVEINAHAGQLREQLGLTNTDVRNVNAELERVKEFMQGFSFTLEDTKNKADAAADAAAQAQSKGPMEFMRRLTGAQEDINKLREAMGSDKAALLGQLEDLSGMVNKNASDIQRMGDVQAAHSDDLHSTGERTGALESGQTRLSERTEKAEGDIVNLTAWRNETHAKVQSHDTELSHDAELLHQEEEELRVCKDDLRAVHEELAAMNEMMAKNGTRLDLAHEYFSGFTKGFRGERQHHKNLMSLPSIAGVPGNGLQSPQKTARPGSAGPC